MRRCNAASRSGQQSAADDGSRTKPPGSHHHRTDAAAPPPPAHLPARLRVDDALRAVRRQQVTERIAPRPLRAPPFLLLALPLLALLPLQIPTGGRARGGKWQKISTTGVRLEISGNTEHAAPKCAVLPSTNAQQPRPAAPPHPTHLMYSSNTSRRSTLSSAMYASSPRNTPTAGNTSGETTAGAAGHQCPGSHTAGAPVAVS